MKCYILDPSLPTTQTGSSLRKLIQNSTDPILDLFVRESLQNSLDAGDNGDSKYVKADYIIGKFGRKQFNAELDKITEKLDALYPDEEYKFIAIKDANTTGLKGPLKATEIFDNQWGNLRSLVYNICRPQEQPGSGGCWGIGKTVYFRLSECGIVVYYSRTINKEGKYESRLCAAIVEDEKKANTILPAFDSNNNKSGIGWWGDIEDNGQSYPITDDTIIDRFLANFGIDPYGPEETGTIVIIPYINENDLLTNNRVSNNDGEQDLANTTPWGDSLEEYIRLSVQRWYAPRLDNPFYYREKRDDEDRVFKFLKASVNGREIKNADMEPIFKVFQDLYNSCISKIYNIADIPTTSFSGIQIKDIEYRRMPGYLGQFAYVQIDKNKISSQANFAPHLNIWSSSSLVSKNGENMPILSMTRRPGMMVEYNSQYWFSLDEVPKTTDDKYILGLFVLNSTSKLTNEDFLEEYFRKGGENADHMGWHDHSNLGTRGKYVYQIFFKTMDTLRSAFVSREEKTSNPKVAGIGTLLGRAFQINGTKKDKGGTGSGNDRPITIKKARLELLDVVYKIDEMCVILEMTSTKKVKGSSLVIKVDSDSAPVDADSWLEDTKLPWPFPVKQCTMMSSFDSVVCTDIVNLIGNSISCERFDIELKKAKDGSVCGFDFVSKNDLGHTFAFKLEMTLMLALKDVKPIIQIK